MLDVWNSVESEFTTCFGILDFFESHNIGVSLVEDLADPHHNSVLFIHGLQDTLST